MKKLKITTENKASVVQRYVDNIAYRMDDCEIYDAFKDYFYREKMSLDIDSLTQEIEKYHPEILEEHIFEPVFNKGA